MASTGADSIYVSVYPREMMLPDPHALPNRPGCLLAPIPPNRIKCLGRCYSRMWILSGLLVPSVTMNGGGSSSLGGAD